MFSVLLFVFCFYCFVICALLPAERYRTSTTVVLVSICSCLEIMSVLHVPYRTVFTCISAAAHI